MSLSSVQSRQLKGKWLAAARVAWFLVAGIGVGLNVLGLPRQFAQWASVCDGVKCAADQITPQQAQTLQQFGLSLQVWASYITIVGILPQLAFLLVGAVIFWRKSDDTMALLTSFMLVSFGLAGSFNFQGISPILQLAAVLFQALGNFFFTLFIVLFPDGHFVPRWVRWLVIPAAAESILIALFPDNSLLGSLDTVVIFAGVLIPIYRYWRISNAMQRQQTKWVVFGVTMALCAFGGVSLLLGPIVQPGNSSNVLVDVLSGTIDNLFFILIPISIGIAILRSRLWDIDLIIRRTLVYGSLTALLVAVYVGSVVGSQTLLRPLLGENSDLTIVISTLVIAALFLPLRRWTQSFIDRRFYRRKYDATRTLEAFSRAARDEVDLDELTGRLVEVVDETMQPAHVWLWLRQPERKA